MEKKDWAALEQFMGEGAWPPNRGFVTSMKETLQPARYVSHLIGVFQKMSFSFR
ncbi:hypothetical protein [uncultured Pantoea sp.]|uniref:hypothetical protein n=1 Tax=uncultured Pantoea sp. TaxID=218084 RepID=UPI00258576E6|nr:hypothetical protein [uncultured Pantoea sp.]